MQAVPSLVGTGTAVAAAATGLVFGQPPESTHLTSPRPPSPLKRKLFSDFSFDNPRLTPTPPPSSRPRTSSVLSPLQPPEAYPGCDYEQPHPSPLFSHPVSARLPSSTGDKTIPPKPASRRHSYIRPSDVATASSTDGQRDSLSSHSSWMRRLSLRPPSHHDSPRSSLGPDSFAPSQASGPSVLYPTSTNGFSAPNKLVKRMGNKNESIFTRRNSRGQVPSLRRPATSHQRSVAVLESPTTSPIDSSLNSPAMDHSPRPRASTTGQTNSPWRIQDPTTWVSFFHARRVKTSQRRNVMTSTPDSIHAACPTAAMRIRLRRDSLSRPFLISPQMISGERFLVAPVEADFELDDSTTAPASADQSPQMSSNASFEQPEETTTRRVQRSLTSATGVWKARAGSLRRPKRKSVDYSGKRRYASDPTNSSSPDAENVRGSRLGMEELFTPPKSGYREDDRHDLQSSLAPLTLLSSFQLEMSRLGHSPPSSAGMQASSPTSFNPSSAAYGGSAQPHSRTVSKEGASTLAGSDISVPGLASGDDDTDYKSDAMFDSFRTTDSRMVETPLDVMFDEFVHGPTGAVRTKRLSIQEILGDSWDADARIKEEDEGTPTPMRGLREPRIAQDTEDDDRATEIAKFQLSIGNRNPSRLSLDTTDDEWAKDDEDEIMGNPLSPPLSSVNSQRGPSPQLRSALVSISGNGSSECYTIETATERPRSNVFDWVESSSDRNNEALSRPRTVHGKQELDFRGGRLSNRKGFPGVHVRSQSVPIVPELDDGAKGTSNIGTRVTGAKNTSEDWDNDFEFSEDHCSSGSKDCAKGLTMQVPPEIQKKQPSVKAHSGQIKELSLLVDNLRRLCRQGRDMGLLDGQAASLWKDAENIIALASPDEEEAVESDTDRSFSDFDPSTIDEWFLDEGFDASTLDRSETSGSCKPDIPKNSVVKERHVTRRRSVFSPDDDIFGTHAALEKSRTRPPTPRTPERVREFHTPEGTVVSSVIAAMEQQRSQPRRAPESALKPSTAKLSFGTNTLQELVTQASTIFHALSDIVRREELLTTSPQSTPKPDSHTRGGSPAFTRVFSDPDMSSPRHLVKSQKSHSPLPRKSLDSKKLSQRMHMMTVS